MKQSGPYFCSMIFRNSAGTFSRPFSSTFAGACPIKTLSSTTFFLSCSTSFYHCEPLLSTKTHRLDKKKACSPCPAPGEGLKGRDDLEVLRSEEHTSEL